MTNRSSGWVTDEPIAQAIEREIQARMQPGAPPIDVSAQDATVTPTGHVANQATKEALIALACGTPGVVDVNDDLVIGGGHPVPLGPAEVPESYSSWPTCSVRSTVASRLQSTNTGPMRRDQQAMTEDFSSITCQLSTTQRNHENCRKPSTSVIMPITGSTVYLFRPVDNTPSPR